MSAIRLAAVLLPALVGAACRAVPDTLMTAAASQGDVSRISSLAAGGAGVDAMDGNGLTPLMWAARYGHIDAMRTLVRAGADVNRFDHHHGWNVLMHAIHTNQPEAVRRLLDWGANADGRTPSMTPLIMAAGYGYTEMVRDLLTHGADPHAIADNGMTALAAAVGGAPDVDRFTVASCRASTVKALLDRAPDLKVDTTRAEGRWAVRFARIGACDDVLQLIRAVDGG